MNDELQKALAAIKAKDAEGAKMILARLLQDEPDNVPAWLLMSRMAETDVQKAAFLRKILAIDPDHGYARRELSALTETAEEGEAEPALQPAYDAPAGDVEPEASAAELAPAASAVAEEEVLAQPEEQAPPGEQTSPEEQAPPEKAAPEADAGAEAQDMPVSTDPFDYEAQAEGDTLPPWMTEEEVVLEAPVPAATEAAEEVEEPEIPDWLVEAPESAWLGEEEEVERMVAQAQPRTKRQPAGAVEPAGQAAAPAAQATSTGGGLLLALTVITIIVFLLLVYAAATYLPGAL